ncbi:hypothetical protein [Cognatilysobacter bugurensis]|uniref:EF-hand domain-containing protein n=1 Tax=Cognatilysobacter bugurensis TaxID=543356 RepID=A0A918SZI0_9GAMM|nr:hypothetical protein [Lysobacter bugurensis]GHA80331.1 hypothetical protein GCM10007067_17580 [Lysobacter bugurensis]
MKNKFLLGLSAAMTLCFAAGTAGAQAQAQQEATKQIKPLVSTGTTVSMGPNGPAVRQVIPVEMLEGVETVTLDTPRGPVVVISWPTAGSALKAENNIDFGLVDLNDDGYLTSAEIDTTAKEGTAVGRLSKRFKELDVSGDAKLSFDEVVGWVYR